MTLSIFPIAGITEIGANCTAYFDADNLVFVDYGMFLCSVDDITPYKGYFLDLRETARQLSEKSPEELDLHLIITHSHEDHVGSFSLPKFVPEIFTEFRSVHIYVNSMFNKLAVLKHGIDEDALVNTRIHTIAMEKAFSIGDFKITFYPVDHSIPDSSAVLIEYKGVGLLHTGDWKINTGEASSTLKTLDKLEDKCQVVVNESTRASSSTFSVSSNEIKENLIRLIDTNIKKDRTVWISFFSSNVERMCTVVEYATKNNIKIGYMGGTLDKFINIAQACGMMTKEQQKQLMRFFDVDSIVNSKHKIKIISGCQAEEKSTLYRLFLCDKKHKINYNNCFIISASIIPSSIKRVSHMYQKIISSGAKLVCSLNNRYVHCSGHATLKDYVVMYKSLKPKFVIPIHGQYFALKDHIKYCRKVTKDIEYLNTEPKTIFDFKVSEPGKIEFIKTRRYSGKIVKWMAVEDCVVAENDPVLNERRKMIQGGMIMIRPGGSIKVIGTKIDGTKREKIMKIAKDSSADNIVSSIVKQRLFDGLIQII